MNTIKTTDIELDDESRRNLVNLYSLLLKVDKRTNPDIYQEPNVNEE